ncbi:DMT family transporter [Rhodobacteraceae bacterium CCMM004]|nr:DMT family transporter [Rhodobacteraceae bacterium CCMM004]
MGEAARGHLAMLLFSGLVGGSFALGVRIANLIDPAALTAVRFAIAATVIGAAAALSGALRGGGWVRAPWRYGVLGGLLCVYFVLMFEGLKTADPVSAAAVFTLTPLMAAGFDRIVAGRRSRWPLLAALAVGGAGALWVIFDGDVEALLALQIGRGEAIYAVGCIAHAAYVPVVRRLNRGEPAASFTFGTLLGGTALLAVYAAPDLAATAWTALGPEVWAVILYLALFASAATFVLLQYASLRLPAANVMAYTYLTPSFVLVWQVGLSGVWPDPRIMGGILLTAIALFLLLKQS